MSTIDKKKKAIDLLQQGQFQDAKKILVHICQTNKYDAELWFLLGASNGQLGNSAEAETCFREAINLQPDNTNAYYNLGISLRDQKKLKAAVEVFETVTRMTPGHIQACTDLGFIFLDLVEPEKAVNAFRTTVKLKPDAAKTHFNLGLALYAAGKLQEAVACFQKAIKLQPDEAAIYDHLATVYICQGKLTEAIDNHKKAVGINPIETSFYSNFLLSLHYDPKQNRESLFTEHRQWGNAQSKLVTTPDYCVNKPEPNKRLRIGYVSPDFRLHSVTYFMEPLLTHHTSGNFETICYSDVKQPDNVTQRLQKLSNQWRNIYGMSHSDVAEIILKDGIDILVDLSGHTGNNRLEVFSRKPAPVQVTYLGYPDTTGLATIDYRFTDEWADPSGISDPFHTEKLVRLSNGFLCYQPPQDIQLPAPAPRKNSQPITFGSFNKLAKVNNKMIALWSDILKAVPESHLFIKNNMIMDESSIDYYYKQFRANGITRDRVEITDLVASRAEHLKLYDRIDIALDTFPYNGTTTTCEALWMGVPVIVLAGNVHSGRVGVSLLSMAGLTDFIAESPEKYIELACNLANDREQLNELHVNLRNIIQRSPLCDASSFTKEVESAYRTVWEKWCFENNNN